MIVPHPMLAEWLRYRVTFREYDFDVPIISFLDVYTYARSKSGVWWIAAGERIADSIVRRAMIKGDGGVVNPKRGRFFPLAHWSKSDVYAYIRHHRLKVAPETQHLGFSFRSLMGSDLRRDPSGLPEGLRPHRIMVSAQWASVWRSTCLRRNRRVRHERRRDQISER